MAKLPRPDVTSVLDIIGVAGLTAAAYLAFGLAAALAAFGGFCLALSYGLTRRGSA